jgi:hypothetical protein
LTAVNYTELDDIEQLLMGAVQSRTDVAASLIGVRGADLAAHAASVTLDEAEDRWLSCAHCDHSPGKPTEVLRKQVPAQV